MKTFFLIIGLVILGACSKDEKLPEGILDSDKMVSLFIEKYTFEGTLSDSKIKPDSAQVVFNYYKSKILEKHQIPDSVYRASMSYYNQHPKALEAIYETVLDSLNLRKQKQAAKEKPIAPL